MSDLTPGRNSCATLEQFLFDKIPLSRAMNLSVVASDHEHLVLEAPLLPNRNHLGTAFGGSLHALATFAAYSVVWTMLRDAGLDGHVVMRSSDTRYRAPVVGNLRATSRRPDAATCDQFTAHLQRHRKARVEITALIAGEHRSDAVEFRGSFVALT